MESDSPALTSSIRGCIAFVYLEGNFFLYAVSYPEQFAILLYLPFSMPGPVLDLQLLPQRLKPVGLSSFLPKY